MENEELTLKEKIDLAWDTLIRINRKPEQPRFKQITPEEKKAVDDHVKVLRSKGYSTRRIKREILRKFKVKII